MRKQIKIGISSIVALSLLLPQSLVFGASSVSAFDTSTMEVINRIGANDEIKISNPIGDSIQIRDENGNLLMDDTSGQLQLTRTGLSVANDAQGGKLTITRALKGTTVYSDPVEYYVSKASKSESLTPSQIVIQNGINNQDQIQITATVGDLVNVSIPAGENLAHEQNRLYDKLPGSMYPYTDTLTATASATPAPLINNTWSNQELLVYNGNATSQGQGILLDVEIGKQYYFSADVVSASDGARLCMTIDEIFPNEIKPVTILVNGVETTSSSISTCSATGYFRIQGTNNSNPLFAKSNQWMIRFTREGSSNATAPAKISNLNLVEAEVSVNPPTNGVINPIGISSNATGFNRIPEQRFDNQVPYVYFQLVSQRTYFFSLKTPLVESKKYMLLFDAWNEGPNQAKIEPFVSASYLSSTGTITSGNVSSGSTTPTLATSTSWSTHAFIIPGSFTSGANSFAVNRIGLKFNADPASTTAEIKMRIKAIRLYEISAETENRFLESDALLKTNHLNKMFPATGVLCQSRIPTNGTNPTGTVTCPVSEWGQGGGTVSISKQSPLKTESSSVSLLVNRETISKPIPSSAIQVVNFNGTMLDQLIFTGLPMHHQVRLYRKDALGAYKLVVDNANKNVFSIPTTRKLTITLPVDVMNTNTKIYATIQEVDTQNTSTILQPIANESAMTTITIPKPSKSTPVSLKTITIHNGKGISDRIVLSSVKKDDVINVYYKSNAVISQTATADGSMTIALTYDLGTKSGSLQISKTSPGKRESDRVSKSFLGAK